MESAILFEFKFKYRFKFLTLLTNPAIGRSNCFFHWAVGFIIRSFQVDLHDQKHWIWQRECSPTTVTKLQVRMWPIENKVPLSTSGLIDVIKMARTWRKRAPDRPDSKPTIVMSQWVCFPVICIEILLLRGCKNVVLPWMIRFGTEEVETMGLSSSLVCGNRN